MSISIRIIILALLTLLPSNANGLKIAYSDWPGWAVWDIGIRKGWFAEAGVSVEFVWTAYGASMDLYKKGDVDAVCMTNGDALIAIAEGFPAVGIIINDYSNGNDKVITKKNYTSFSDLKGKRIGLEEGLVSHMLFINGLEKAGLRSQDVHILNCPTNKTPEVLHYGAVEAISAWQPISGYALNQVEDSHEIYSSADAPGLIYDLLYVNPKSLRKNRETWLNVVKVWYKIVDFLSDSKNNEEILNILSHRLNTSSQECEKFYKGMQIVSREAAPTVWKVNSTLRSIYGSTKSANEFNLLHGVYSIPVNIEEILDPSFTLQVLSDDTKSEAP